MSFGDYKIFLWNTAVCIFIGNLTAVSTSHCMLLDFSGNQAKEAVIASLQVISRQVPG